MQSNAQRKSNRKTRRLGLQPQLAEERTAVEKQSELKDDAQHRGLRRASDWIATWGWAGLIVAAVGVQAEHEYAIAMFLTFLGAASLTFAILHWRGAPGSPLITIIGRIAGIALAIIFLIVPALWIWGQKGHQPWSRIPTYYTEAFADRSLSAGEQPVSISPQSVVFQQVLINDSSGAFPSLFSQQYSFRITNTTDRDVYDIGVRLDIESDHVSINDFDLGIPKSSWKLLNELDTSSQAGDIMAAECRTKKTSRLFFLVELLHLEPRESREVTISESNPKEEHRDAVTITGAVFHSTFEASPLLKSDKATLFMPKVPLPESGTLEKLIMLNLPKQP